MANRVVAAAAADWAEYEVTGFLPFACTAQVIPGQPNRYTGLNRLKAMSVSSPQYLQAVARATGGATDIARPWNDGSNWEPFLYHGKPGTILSKAKTCLVIIDTNTGISPSAPWSLDTSTINTALDLIIGDALDMGVHVYASTATNTQPWLLCGIPCGEMISGPSSGDGGAGDNCPLVVAPDGYPYGELLIVHINGNHIGIGPMIADWDSMTSTLHTTSNNGILIASDPLDPGICMPSSYYGFASDRMGTNGTSLTNDRAIVAEFLDYIGRFRRVMHVIDDPSIIKTYQPRLGTDPPLPAPPTGWPGLAADVFLDVTGGLGDFQVGAEINSPYDAATVADLIMADIVDFFS